MRKYEKMKAEFIAMANQLDEALATPKLALAGVGGNIYFADADTDFIDGHNELYKKLTEEDIAQFAQIRLS